MKLTVLERLYLLALLPQREDIYVLKIIRDLKNALSLSEEEYKEFGVKVDGDRTSWNARGAEEREISIGEQASNICAQALKDANEKKILTEQHISLYDKFVKD